MTLFFIINGDIEVAALCSMIFLIGLGKLVVYLVERKNNNKKEEEENPSETQPVAENNDNAFKD